MEKQQPIPNTLKQAAYSYHTGLFDAFENWIEAHKEAFGRFTLNDAHQVRQMVKHYILQDKQTMLAALDFQMDGKIDKYETFEMPSF